MYPFLYDREQDNLSVWLNFMFFRHTCLPLKFSGFPNRPNEGRGSSEMTVGLNSVRYSRDRYSQKSRHFTGDVVKERTFGITILFVYLLLSEIFPFKEYF